jgi:exopolysaccharide biosynthesis WecB/TagA/CpsF family protein
MVKLFDVNLPQITKWELKEKIVNLEPNKKHSLYWLYSEFLLRANRNPWYKKVLNESTFSAIDGKGLHWSMYRTMSFNLLPELYAQRVASLPTIIRIPVFLLFLFIQLVINMFDGFLRLTVLKTNFSSKTLNETILGRDFTYELLKICNLKKYKTMIIGGSNEDDEVSKNLIQNIYPDLDLLLWTRKTNSLLMTDNIQNSIDVNIGKNLTTSNLYQFFPDLIEAKQAVIANKPDVILVCIGGASGKQEFFIHDLMNDNNCQFQLATGLGAAIDHLGSGAKQALPPVWSQSLGLEWLWRFIDQPYRRFRIIDSIFTLYWWSTIHLFTKEILNKRFIGINKLNNNNSEVLIDNISDRIGYSLPFNYIKKGESIEEAGIKFINSNYGLELTTSNVKSIPEKGRNVQEPISLFHFLKNQAYYTSIQYFVNFFACNNCSGIKQGKFVTSEEYLKLTNPDFIQFETSQ